MNALPNIIVHTFPFHCVVNAAITEHTYNDKQLYSSHNTLKQINENEEAPKMFKSHTFSSSKLLSKI